MPPDDTPGGSTAHAIPLFCTSGWSQIIPARHNAYRRASAYLTLSSQVYALPSGCPARRHPKCQGQRYLTDRLVWHGGSLRARLTRPSRRSLAGEKPVATPGDRAKLNETAVWSLIPRKSWPLQVQELPAPGMGAGIFFSQDDPVSNERRLLTGPTRSRPGSPVGLPLPAPRAC